MCGLPGFRATVVRSRVGSLAVKHSLTIRHCSVSADSVPGYFYLTYTNLDHAFCVRISHCFWS